MVKIIIFILTIILTFAVILVACFNIQAPDNVANNIETPIKEEILSPNESSSELKEETITEPTDIQNIELDISDIPYFGNREEFLLSTQLALTYWQPQDLQLFSLLQTHLKMI